MSKTTGTFVTTGHLKSTVMQKIMPSLWFNNNAEEAMDFYASVFKSFRVFNKSYYGKGMGAPEGLLLSATFELEGEHFIAINGGPLFPFTEAVSFTINCENQAEIDDYWTRLTADGGRESQCGWLKDKYGLSWQVVPAKLSTMVADKDPAVSSRVMAEVMKMVKLDIATLEKAYNGH
ncbi:MAG: VOC family protein [Chitinophaga sp.]|uniref:VOC family protein n=1 Tax=Chitinophaga sp. TaxID=1869181 RepID=UPI001B157AF5|nr:VOC family protein [Chitinophaga sp.]MBO9728745.1 VOC family protein [Chitinophaga sp.]